MKLRIAVVSDVHYAGKSERLRKDHEAGVIGNPILRMAVKAYRHHVWLRDPFAHNTLLPNVCDRIRDSDLVVANGDYSCDSAFIGLADDPSFESACEAVGILRSSFADRLLATIGDHELGKKSLFGGVGGMRIRSWTRTISELSIQPFWTRSIGSFHLVGVTSSLWALPVFSTDALPDELGEWQNLQAEQARMLEVFLEGLKSSERWILFCHDPTALPFLAVNQVVASRLGQLEATIIGHLHSELILRKSRLLAGMPSIRFLGNSIRRMSRALQSARTWDQFRPTLCPSLAGVELLKDGGFLRLEIDPVVPGSLHIFRETLPRANP